MEKKILFVDKQGFVRLFQLQSLQKIYQSDLQIYVIFHGYIP